MIIALNRIIVFNKAALIKIINQCNLIHIKSHMFNNMVSMDKIFLHFHLLRIMKEILLQNKKIIFFQLNLKNKFIILLKKYQNNQNNKEINHALM